VTDILRIANCSGFYGDRLSAAREMVEGGPIDVLTGDYLAELTMAILYKSRAKKPETGYATTFVTQMEQVLGACLAKGIKVVANAGGLNPAGCAAASTSSRSTTASCRRRSAPATSGSARPGATRRKSRSSWGRARKSS